MASDAVDIVTSQVLENYGTEKRYKLLCGLTVGEFVDLVKVIWLGYLDLGSDVGVALEWLAAGDTNWALAFLVTCCQTVHWGAVGLNSRLRAKPSLRVLEDLEKVCRSSGQRPANEPDRNHSVRHIMLRTTSSLHIMFSQRLYTCSVW